MCCNLRTSERRDTCLGEVVVMNVAVRLDHVPNVLFVVVFCKAHAPKLSRSSSLGDTLSSFLHATHAGVA